MKYLSELDFEELAAVVVDEIESLRESAIEKKWDEDVKISLLRGALLRFGGFKPGDCDCKDNDNK